MSKHDESRIRDADLRAKLDGMAVGSIGYSSLVGVLTQSQEKRDADAKAAASRKAELAAMPREKRRRAVVREVIETDGPSPEYLRYMPTPLAICGLPYKQLPEGQIEYERSQGRMAVSVTAGKLRAPNGQRVQQPVPYGPKARLIMAHLATEAKRNNSPIVETSESLSGFMLDMGFDPRGGKNGNIEPFKEQLRALAACSMQISAWDGKRSGQINVQPFKKMELWFSDNPAQQSLWPTRISFSQDFFNELQEHALPIDVRVLRALSNSARRLDLMMWVTYRITRLNAPLVLDWKPLTQQFGEGYTEGRFFRRDFANDVAALKEIFPKVPLKLTERGLEMEPADAAALLIPKRTLTSR
jgi:hypothetical protein